MFKVSPASLQTFIDTPNCVLEHRVQYSTVHIPNVFCDGHLQIINCVGIVIVMCTVFLITLYMRRRLLATSCPSVRLSTSYRLGTHRTNFHEIWYLIRLLEFVQKNPPILLQLGKKFFYTLGRSERHAWLNNVKITHCCFAIATMVKRGCHNRFAVRTFPLFLHVLKFQDTLCFGSWIRYLHQIEYKDCYKQHLVKFLSHNLVDVTLVTGLEVRHTHLC
jgi:hypothetical protein